MTVKELIEQLERFPQEAKVSITYINKACDYGFQDEEEEREIATLAFYGWGNNPELHLSTYDEDFNSESFKKIIIEN